MFGLKVPFLMVLLLWELLGVYDAAVGADALDAIVMRNTAAFHAVVCLLS